MTTHDSGASSPTGTVSLLAIDEAAALLAAIVASSSDAILSNTLDGIITSWNTATTELFGYSAPEMIGQSIHKIVPHGLHSEEDAILARVAGGERVENYETVRLHKNGEPIDVSVTISPIREPGGRVIGASNIVRDISLRKQAETNSALLAAIVTSSFDGIISKTLDGTITSWNAAARCLFGYTAEEMIGQSIRRLIPGNRQGEEDDILSRIRAGEVVETFETVRIRKDGQPIEVAITISPVRAASGRVIGASKIVRDITEQKKAQRQIRDLMGEVNHRAKNMLALVQVIARQTMNSNSENFLERFSHRLQAISANQDLLVRNNWLGADLEDLVRIQLEPFTELVGARIAVSGPGVRLSSAAAQSIGMALHELLTNAVKYGALSNEVGRIGIDWQEEGDEFTLGWSERDGPLVEQPKRGGFGSKVVSDIVESGVDGEVEIDFASSGLRWRLRCPAKNIRY
jgi:PAS domain S-box-containing protein